METPVKKLAERIKQEGGRLMLVGGCVRDEIMGLAPKDFDCEVFNLPSEKLREVISEFGKVDAVGASFQVYKVGQDIDVSLPRRERKTGVGHKGFTVEGDPDMSFQEACSRRDFTINAVMKDPLTGEIVDPFNGQRDIKEQVLRMVSPKAFREDSLRVLRLVQFMSRFNFEPDYLTYDFARRADLSDLPKERVWMEIEKLLLKSEKPSVGVLAMQNLGVTGQLFPSLRHYANLQTVIDRAVQFCAGLSNGEKLVVLVSILLWESYNEVYDELGLSSVGGYDVRKKVEEILTYKHMPLGNYYDYHKMSQKLNMKLFGRILKAFNAPICETFNDTIRNLGIEEKPAEPYVKGRHLIGYGMKPCPEMGQLLAELYEAQLKGVPLSGVFVMARGSLGISDVPDYPIEGKYQHLVNK
jgi:tRNA nucleotidyltransferase (CCA-adding enzyme)